MREKVGETREKDQENEKRHEMRHNLVKECSRETLLRVDETLSKFFLKKVNETVVKQLGVQEKK